MTALAPLAVAALAAAPYLGALRHGFVSFDDPQMIEGNPLVRGAAGPLAAFASFRMTSWQPLGWLLYRALDRIGGGSPVPFHAASLILHALNAGLAAALLSAVLGKLPKPPGTPASRAAAAALAALAWAWHPVQAESVVWASQLSDLLCASFVLGGLLARESGRPWGGAAGLLLAGLCRWKAVVFLPFALALDLAAGRLKRARAAEYAVLAALTAALVAVNAAAKATGGYAAAFRPHEAAAGALWQLRKLAFPAGLAPSFVFDGAANPLSLSAASAISAAALIAAAALYLARRSRPALGALAAFAAGLAPALAASRPGAVPLYDHHLYLPLLAGAGALAVALARARPAARWAALPALLLLGGLSAVQAGYWKDSESLWGRVLAVYPASQTARYNLALSRGSQGRWVDALLSVDDQLALFPADRAASDFRETLLRWAAATPAQRARLLSDAASVRFERGDAAGALSLLGEALGLSPREPVILVNAAIAEAALGRREPARALLRRALKAAPGHAPAREALARLEAAK